MSRDNDSNIILGEQFWFTAAAFGFNAFLLSQELLWVPLPVIGVASTFVTLYAGFLIVLRSARHADQIDYGNESGKEEKYKGFQQKWRETRIHFKAIWKHLPYVIGEFSGSLFCLFIILLSYVGVVMKLLR
jgi:hypothetical protein